MVRTIAGATISRVCGSSLFRLLVEASNSMFLGGDDAVGVLGGEVDSASSMVSSSVSTVVEVVWSVTAAAVIIAALLLVVVMLGFQAASANS
jgi:hypothetical protein